MRRPGVQRECVGMTTATSTILLILATFVMLSIGIDKKRLEWKRRDPGWWRKRKPPTGGPKVMT